MPSVFRYDVKTAVLEAKTFTAELMHLPEFSQQTKPVLFFVYTK
jgi:hypothetical protein